MQRKTKIIAAAAAAVLLTLGGLAGLASADMGHGYGMMGGGMGGGCQGGKGRGHGMMGQQMTERYDADKDGKLDRSELNAAAERMTEKMAERRREFMDRMGKRSHGPERGDP